MRKLSGAVLSLVCAAVFSHTAIGQVNVHTLPGPFGAQINNPPVKHPRAVGDENTAAAAAASGSTFTGTLQLGFTIRLATPVPSGGTVLCSLTASVQDTSTSGLDGSFTEIDTATATVSGSTATCTAKIPYSWYLVDAATDVVELGYTVAMVGPSTSITTVAGASVRESSGDILGAASIKIPATGTITYLHVAPTI